MAKIINITDRLCNDKPSIQIGEKIYPVNDGLKDVMKFEELAVLQTQESLKQALEVSLGKEAVNEMGIDNWSVGNFKVITIAIMAAISGVEYEEAEERFRQKESTL